MARVGFDMLIALLPFVLSLRANTTKCTHSKVCGFPCRMSIQNEKNTFLNVDRNDLNETSNERPGSSCQRDSKHPPGALQFCGH